MGIVVLTGGKLYRKRGNFITKGYGDKLFILVHLNLQI